MTNTAAKTKEKQATAPAEMNGAELVVHALVEQGVRGRWRWTIDRLEVGSCGKSGIGRV